MTRLLLIFCLALSVALAQHHDTAAENPVALYAGLGVWHHPIHTSNAEAQKFFDQGLALMYGFNRYESLRSFRKAAELDPQSAMAYWGMAMAEGPYINSDMDEDINMKNSCRSVEAGLKIAGAAERERAYLEAAAKRCPQYKPQAYIEAMQALAARWPDDLDAATLYAESLMIPVRWRWYSASGTPAPGVTTAESVLEEVIRRWPDHPGANHLYIHIVESSPTPERGIPSAQRLMGIMPWAGHMVHMPGHIWLAVGDYAMAGAVNERAVTVDREYLERTRVTTSGYFPYYLHNLSFIAYARWMQGRKTDGIRAADDLSLAAAPMAERMPGMADAFHSYAILGRVRFNDWDGILQLTEPKESLRVTRALWKYARALAFAGRGDRAVASREQGEFETLRSQIPAGTPWGNNKAKAVLAIASAVIAARLAPAPAEALPHWQLAVELQDKLTYDEPPGWYYPIRESLGACLLRAGRAADAEAMFREGVKRSPRNGRMLFGLMESLRAQSKNEDAELVKREFEAAWSKADVLLSVEAL